ncbi:hypothetical protein [Streptomyces erythrochromogenes]|uniref:hypothetical protein n=1 Tax=Streptomyces erythrochromogenes TaxID=285574 RepID=UPI0036CC3413
MGSAFLADCLVDVSAAEGRDEEVAAPLEAHVAAAVPVCDDPDCGRPGTAGPDRGTGRTLADRPGGAEGWEFFQMRAGPGAPRR